MNKLVTFFVIILILTLSTTLVDIVNAEFTSGRVMYVHDGDTFWVDIEEKSIGLADIKAIDLGALRGLDAKNYLYGKTFDKIVILDIDDRNRFATSGTGIVAIVYVVHNSTHYLNVNKAMIDEDLATIWDEENNFNPYHWFLYVPRSSIPLVSPIKGNWSEVATFTGELIGGNGVIKFPGEVNGSIITDSFICDHIDWRIRWKAGLRHLHFPIANYSLALATFPEGTDVDYIDFVDGTEFSIYHPAFQVWGTRYIHNNSGNFYMKINPSVLVNYYIIAIEENIDSPAPAQETSPDKFTIGSNVIIPILMIVAIIGSIAIITKLRKK